MTIRLLLALGCLPFGAPRALGADPERLTSDGSFKQNVTWSPDGSTLLFTRIHEGKMALWTMPSKAGGEMKRAVARQRVVVGSQGPR